MTLKMLLKLDTEAKLHIANTSKRTTKQCSKKEKAEKSLEFVKRLLCVRLKPATSRFGISSPSLSTIDA